MLESKEVYYATGRRKTSSAKVYLRRGKGSITINKKDYKNYFPSFYRQAFIEEPLKKTQSRKLYDITVSVSGGGETGQMGAIRHGLSRVLTLVELKNRASLKSAGFLTRDSRKVERKKYGRHKARKSTQFSKR